MNLKIAFSLSTYCLMLGCGSGENPFSSLESELSAEVAYGSTGWSKSWDEILPISIGSKQYLIFNDRTDEGESNFSIYAVTDDGRLGKIRVAIFKPLFKYRHSKELAA